ncbi:MAG: DNA-binding FadR family transcriptional regulator [Myxococcota bacterium]|jgi:DNA-binding FadR family transcriptional regulator
MQSTSRSAAIAAELRDEILRGQYRSGERLPSERDLALRYGVHRGAIREALKRLEQLGVAHIHPGGARVAPIEEASLDVVEHILALEDPPNPQMVDQVIEVMSGLFSMAARLCAERASDAQREEIRGLLSTARNDMPSDDRIALMQTLGDLFVEASDNLVLKLVRRGVKTKFLEQLKAHRSQVLPPFPANQLNFNNIGSAIEAKDGAAAAEAVLALTSEIRQHALQSITYERERLSDEGTSS